MVALGMSVRVEMKFDGCRETLSRGGGEAP
jgi:hypothetical protein